MDRNQPHEKQHMKPLIALAACVAITFSQGVIAQTVEEYFDELKAAGYTLYQTISFAKTKQKKALSALHKGEGDKNPLMFVAEIVMAKEGASLYFREFGPCVQSTQKDRLDERIIIVSNQKIEAYYLCGIGSGDRTTNAVYIVKSPAGQAFVNREFEENEYVYVRLNKLPVPFSTEGYRRAMTESGGKAL